MGFVKKSNSVEEMSHNLAPLPSLAANLGSCNIRYTPHQAELAKSAGMDTSQWHVDARFASDDSGTARGNNRFAMSWLSPKDFDGTHLRIPYRFKKENYNDAQMQDMSKWLNDMSGDMDGCIEFFDDTETKLYPYNYVLIRNTDPAGVYDGGCWAMLGYSSPSAIEGESWQPINMGAACIGIQIMQHEMIHTLGFLHEQQRPDRDDFVDILYSNIQPSFQYAFDKMDFTAWENFDQIYDLKSIMHYEGNAFMTDAAIAADSSSIVYPGTMDRVVINAPSMSSIDIVQMASRYNNYCTVPTDQISCSDDENDGYYLSWKGCNGYNDCLNGADEGFDTCQDMGCGQVIEASGLDAIAGTYHMIETEYTNGKPAYYCPEKGHYLYTAPNNNWHFAQWLGGVWSTAWTERSECPTGLPYKANGENGWEVFPGITVSCLDCPTTTTTDPITTVPPTLPPNAQWCSQHPSAGFYFNDEECDLIQHCDNGGDETFAKCGDGGCGQALEVVGAGDLNGFYLISYSDGFFNGKPYYHRPEPSNMYIYSSKSNGNWHFDSELGVDTAIGWAPQSDCVTTGPWHLWNEDTNDSWQLVDDFHVNCLDCVDITIPETTTATTTTKSPWNEDVCAEDANKVDYWMKSNRGTKVLRAGEHTYLIKLKMSQADENNHYTMFLTWGKKNCGVDFIEKLGNGGVMIDLMDKSAEYKFVGKHTGMRRHEKHYNTVFQFENNALDCEDCLGSSTDQMELIVHFIDPEGVDWGNKDPLTCLGTLRAGYAGAFKAPVHIAEDVSPCVAWDQKFW